MPLPGKNWARHAEASVLVRARSGGDMAYERVLSFGARWSAERQRFGDTADVHPASTQRRSATEEKHGPHEGRLERWP